jgi:hypothetical protein
MRLVLCFLLLLSAKLSFADTQFETAISSPTFKIGNSNKETSSNGNSITLGLNTVLQNKLFASGTYIATNATINNNLIKSKVTRGAIGYVLADDLSIWTGAGRKTAVELRYSTYSVDGGGFNLSDQQMEFGWSGKYAIASKIFTDVSLNGSLNDPEKSYDAHLKLGYLLGFGEVVLGFGERQTVIEGVDSSESYYTIGFVMSR